MNPITESLAQRKTGYKMVVFVVLFTAIVLILIGLDQFYFAVPALGG